MNNSTRTTCDILHCNATQKKNYWPPTYTLIFFWTPFFNPLPTSTFYPPEPPYCSSTIVIQFLCSSHLFTHYTFFLLLFSSYYHSFRLFYFVNRKEKTKLKSFTRVLGTHPLLLSFFFFFFFFFLSSSFCAHKARVLLRYIKKFGVSCMLDQTSIYCGDDGDSKTANSNFFFIFSRLVMFLFLYHFYQFYFLLLLQTIYTRSP